MGVTDAILSDPKWKRGSSVVMENKARKSLPEMAVSDAAGEIVPGSNVGDAESQPLVPSVSPGADASAQSSADEPLRPQPANLYLKASIPKPAEPPSEKMIRWQEFEKSLKEENKELPPSPPPSAEEMLK